tara:strand:+ start:124 stop:789 length:666 start_codon:yes stop_codon:yes gene_type:complete
MKGLLYLVIGTPKADGISIICKHTEQERGANNSKILLPPENQEQICTFSNWKWVEGKFFFESAADEQNEEWFLFLSNQINLADQLEASLELLNAQILLELARVISFVNCDDLDHKDIVEWMDGVAHFSDILCFSNRTNTNGKKLNEFVERYKSMHYPLESIILSKRKSTPLNQILSTIPRRITHIFEPSELLEDNDSPDQDFYMQKLPNGNRCRTIPNIYS